MTIEEMRKAKDRRGYTCVLLQELTGVPLRTLQAIFGGEENNPEQEAREALEKVFSEPLVLRETSAYQLMKKPGTYTIEDYRALPDEERVELIDGNFYVMAGPTTFHQLMAGEIHRQVANYIRDGGGACTPFISPVDIQLDRDEKTMVQPDVVIVCNPDQIITQNVVGAPDFVLEVISPGTRTCERVLKSD